LLGRRAIEPARGMWDIPGGFLHAWEHPADAAVREVHEETGLRVRVGDVLHVVIDTYAAMDYTLNVYYVAEIIEGSERAADDIAELRWFSPSELPGEYAFAHCADVLAKWTDSLG
jgi:8-oxo-dGTP diphosphatase